MKKRIGWSRYKKQLENDTFRYYFQMILLSGVLGTVALFMTVLNIVTHIWLLMSATAIFSAFSYINFFLLLKNRKCGEWNYILLESSFLVLFSYFLLTGGTAGFSPLWILLLPACGMVFFGKKRGIVLSSLMYAVVIFFLWTPYGKEIQMTVGHFDCDPTFALRFPIVYGAFFAVGYLFEAIRVTAYAALTDTQNQLKTFSETDQLTRVYNRYYFSEQVQKQLNGTASESDCLFLLADIDDFKQVNDVYGHSIGDIALRAVAESIQFSIGKDDFVCRWGGEEFFVYIRHCPVTEARSYCEGILDAIRAIRLEDTLGNPFSISISIGAVSVMEGEIISADAIFTETDKGMYEAKSEGKNRAVVHY